MRASRPATSEPIRPHLPVAPPAGELAAAELQDDARIDGVKTWDARRPLHQIALRATCARKIDEGCLDESRDLILGHAEGKSIVIGVRIACRAGLRRASAE